MTDQFKGSTALGGPVNFRDVYFNPHGHGTHTECVGHISNPILSVNRYLERFWFTAQVLSVEPAVLQRDERYMKSGDRIIQAHQLVKSGLSAGAEALVIRTRPNPPAKRNRVYSGANPPYLHPDAMRLIQQAGFEHLLIDLPSVDRESDEGLLECHHIFWEYPDRTAFHRTITELIYVSDRIPDGRYVLNLQVAPFENDAAPSRPVLYALLEPDQ